MITHIVIPIGVSAEGTPVQKYLEDSVNSILNQTCQDYILTVAADNNIPDRIKIFLESKNIEIKYFEPHSWFKRGSIWTKIFDTWEEKEADNVAFLHYDDLWDKDKLSIQHSLMESNNLLGSYSEAYVIDGNDTVLSGDCSFPILNITTVGRRTMAFAHSIIVNKSALFNSGILEYSNYWAGNFEDMYCLFFHKIYNISKANGAKFYWRDHVLNQSTTHSETAKYVLEQRAAIGYSLAECIQDVNKIEFQRLIDNIKQKYQ